MRRLLVVAAALLAGCRVGPDYEAPKLEAPGAWSSGASGDVALRWWTLFKDPVLDSLVARAVAANPELRMAQARTREARALAVAARGASWPEVEAGAGVTRSRSSGNGMQPDMGQDLERTLYRAGFDASWELDFFGGNRRSVEAAEADVEAAEEEGRSVLVSLLGEVARNYVELRGAAARVAVLGENLRSARESLELTRRRVAGGLGTSLDVARSEALLAQTEADLPAVEAERRRALHRLGVLLGRDPVALSEELKGAAPVPAAPERIGVGLPSELLSRRPDVRRAERRLAAATARVGAATAELYPKFSLLGAFGLESVDASDLLKGASRFWSIGPALRLPLYRGGRSKAGVEVAEARVAEARAGYEQAFLGALEEVENALVGWAREVERRRSLASAVEANRRAVELSRELLAKGLVSSLDVLEAERQLYATQDLAARSQAAVSSQAVALYKALGGGWEEK